MVYGTSSYNVAKPPKKREHRIFNYEMPIVQDIVVRLVKLPMSTGSILDLQHAGEN
uniref:Uncharacterized protein n=1 Tax=Arundo donax TaxID=35708 RepID=A0A0A9A5B8_ARUDO